MLKKIIITALAAVMLAGGGLFLAPRPAQADTNSTIAIAAAAIVGLLTFDELNRPYYVRDGERCYVPDDVADYYFQQNYGGWYGNYRCDWYYNRPAFIIEYRNHFGGGGYYGYNRGYNNGYNRGYDRSYGNGYNRVYNNGYTNNYRQNYNNGNGYNRGVAGTAAAITIIRP